MTRPPLNSPMQPTLQTFIGVFVNNLGIEYSMNVWSGIRDPGNFIPDVHLHYFSCISFQPALDKKHTVKPGQVYP